MKLSQLTIITKDRVGVLAEISELLAKEGINIEGISAERVGDQGVIRMVTENAERAAEILQENGYRTLESDALVVELVDKPGELAKLARKLAAAGINIENIFLLEKREGKGIFALKVDQPEKAREIL